MTISQNRPRDIKIENLLLQFEYYQKVTRLHRN